MTPTRAQQIAHDFDLRALPADFYADPYPVYDQLRATTPVRQMPDGCWFLTRYADLLTVYRDAHTFSSDKRIEFAPKYGDSPLFAHHTTSLVFNDPPRHTRVRRLIMGALTRRAISAMEPGLTALVGRLLDALAARGGGDLIEHFASAIPVDVIGNLLGVPAADRGPLRGWSLAILGALEPALTTQQQELGNASVSAFCGYLRELIAERRKHPADPEHDVLTRLIRGEAQDADGELSEQELLHNCIFILNAGHETTTNLIGNALVCLHAHPRARRELLARQRRLAHDHEAQQASMDAAVDEFLRFESSNQLGNRRARTGCMVGGTELPEGALITLCIGAANRDPAQFADPGALDLQRRDNRHLAFGFGIHQCAGLSLARLEGRIAIGQFLQRFPDFRLTAAPQRTARVRFRGFVAAPFAVA